MNTLQKIGELAILGASWRPKAKGVLYEQERGRSCFIGALMEADGIVNWSTWDGSVLREIQYSSELEYRYPVLSHPLKLNKTIRCLCVNLNNFTDLSREDIAELLTSIKDFDPTVSIKEPQPCDTSLQHVST